MVTQRVALIIFAEQPTLFEDRHDPVDEVVEPAIQPWRHDIEAIGRTLTEPGLYPVRHLFRRSGNHLVAAPAGKPVQPICLMYEDAHGRQTTAPAYIDDVSLKASLEALLKAGPITAHVYVGDALEPGMDRRSLAARAEGAVGAALAAMRSASSSESERSIA